MDTRRPGHIAYLLRLWCVTNGKAPIWRASLQDVSTGERRGFAGLDQACRFLQAQIEAASAGPAEGDGARGRPPSSGT
jgi:hypothetical protein